MGTKKGILIGLISGAVLSSSIAYASDSIEKKILASYGVVKKIIIDGADRTPTASDPQPFIYEGRTYVPLRYISESIGKPVNWDALTGTINIGSFPGEIVYLTDIKPYNIEDYTNEIMQETYYKIDSNKMMMLGTTYTKGLQLEVQGYKSCDVYYNLNAKYKSIKGLVGLDDNGDSFNFPTPVVVDFLLDDKNIGSIKFNKGDFPKPIELNVSGGLKLVIRVTAESNNSPIINFVDMKIE